MLNSCRIWSPTQFNTHPHPFPSHTLSVYYFDFGNGGELGGGEPERRLEGQQLTKLGRKYQHDRLYLTQSITSINSLLLFSPWVGPLSSVADRRHSLYISKGLRNSRRSRRLLVSNFVGHLAFLDPNLDIINSGFGQERLPAFSCLTLFVKMLLFRS